MSISLIGVLAGEASMRTCESMARGLVKEAESLHLLLFEAPRSVSDLDQEAAARVIGILLTSLMLEGGARRMLEHSLPFFETIRAMAEAKAGETCDCPLHRAQQEAAKSAG